MTTIVERLLNVHMAGAYDEQSAWRIDPLKWRPVAVRNSQEGSKLGCLPQASEIRG